MDSQSLELLQESSEALSESQILTESEAESDFEPDPESQLKEPYTPRPKQLATSRDTRIAIKTALLFQIPCTRIRDVLDVSFHQIAYANRHRATPQFKKCNHFSLINTLRREELQQWLLASSSRRHIPWKAIPLCNPQFRGIGEKAITTAMKTLGYIRRKAKKKGFSDDPKVIADRVAFAETAKLWSRERLYLQMFSDEVWAKGGAHTVEWITKLKNGSKDYYTDCV